MDLVFKPDGNFDEVYLYVSFLTFISNHLLIHFFNLPGGADGGRSPRNRTSCLPLSTRQSLSALHLRSGPSNHSRTLISSPLFIRRSVVSSTSIPPTLFIVTSSRVTSWLTLTVNSKYATSVSRGDTLPAEVPTPRAVLTKVS
jgi:hypothetical protein